MCGCGCHLALIAAAEADAASASTHTRERAPAVLPPPERTTIKALMVWWLHRSAFNILNHDLSVRIGR